MTRTPGTQPKGNVFGLLSNQRRRYAVHACRQLDSPIEIGDLAEQIAAWEYDKPREALHSEERRRVYTSLQQTHLGALDDAGVIDYERGTIEPTERAEELEVYLDIVPEGSIPWAEYYLGLTAVAAVLTSSIWLGVYPEFIPDLVWMALLVIAFGLSAVVHVWENKRHRLGSEGSPPDVDR